MASRNRSGRKTETLADAMLRIEATQAGPPVDDLLVDGASLSLINWARSDNVAVYQFLAVLVRRALDDAGTITVNVMKNGSVCESANSSTALADTSADSAIDYADKSLTTQSQRGRVDKVFSRDASATQQEYVVMFDGLNGFDLKHFASTLKSTDALRRLQMVRSMDQFALFGTLCRIDTFISV